MAGDRGRRPVPPARGRAQVELLTGLLTAALAGGGFELEGVEVTRPGPRSVVRVIVDRDGGIDLDALAEASRISAEILAAADPITGAYVLELSSPGVDRPLSVPRHWRRAIGRLIRATGTGGSAVEGRLLAADDTGADVETPTGRTRLRFADVRRAEVQVEFDRSGEAAQGDVAKG